MEPKPATGGTGSGSHSPTRPKNPSTSDAKALRPDILDTSLPSMQMKDWYKKWTNYMMVSGWCQEGNKRTKLAYLCTVVSDEIHTAINYDSITTEARAIHEIKTYLNEAVIPLTLQHLEMLRYKPPSVQSQTLTTQHLIQMFRECEGFAMTPEETMMMTLINQGHSNSKSRNLSFKKHNKSTYAGKEISRDE